MMLSTPILLDYQSSTPCIEDVVISMAPYWSEIFSNPSSKSNLAGINTSAILEASREKIQECLFLQKKKVIFTSGATESNNLALLGFARNHYKETEKYGHIITLKTEHKAVLEPIDQLRMEGFHVTELCPEKDGLISVEKFINSIRDDTFLVSIMMANNEIGVIQPLKIISEICQSREIILHSDFAQCLGFLELDSIDSAANMLTISSHKIYGPKGVGLLLIDRDIRLQPLILGGGQDAWILSYLFHKKFNIRTSLAVRESSINNSIKNWTNIYPCGSFIDNIDNLFNLILNIKPDFVINTAALSSSKDCNKSPDLVFKINGEFPIKLIKFLSINKINSIHFGSILEREYRPECTYTNSKLLISNFLKDVILS